MSFGELKIVFNNILLYPVVEILYFMSVLNKINDPKDIFKGSLGNPVIRINDHATTEAQTKDYVSPPLPLKKLS